MTGTTHQTTRLSTGRHSSPAQGACVMELASMLAGERFTDAPASVCPVIRDFLRSYNDRIDDGRRQDLYACAAAIVGSRSTPLVERERLRLCAEVMHTVRWRWASLPTFPLFPLARHAAMRVGWALATGRDPRHARALALVNDLLGVGRQARRVDDQVSAAAEMLAPSPLRAPVDETYWRVAREHAVDGRPAQAPHAVTEGREAIVVAAHQVHDEGATA